MSARFYTGSTCTTCGRLLGPMDLRTCDRCQSEEFTEWLRLQDMATRERRNVIAETPRQSPACEALFAAVTCLSIACLALLIMCL